MSGLKRPKTFLPVMAVGMKAVAFGNTALGLMAIFKFYPGAAQILPGLIKKSNALTKNSTARSAFIKAP